MYINLKSLLSICKLLPVAVNFLAHHTKRFLPHDFHLPPSNSTWSLQICEKKTSLQTIIPSKWSCLPFYLPYIFQLLSSQLLSLYDFSDMPDHFWLFFLLSHPIYWVYPPSSPQMLTTSAHHAYMRQHYLNELEQHQLSRAAWKISPYEHWKNSAWQLSSLQYMKDKKDLCDMFIQKNGTFIPPERCQTHNSPDTHHLLFRAKNFLFCFQRQDVSISRELQSPVPRSLTLRWSSVWPWQHPLWITTVLATGELGWAYTSQRHRSVSLHSILTLTTS